MTDPKPNTYRSSAFFMPEELRSSLLLKNELTNSSEHESSNLPLEVDNFHSLSLLESSSNLPVPSASTYKATHNLTGIKYCLRRLHGFRVQSVKTMMQVVETWKTFSHPNCIKLREVFTTKAFGDNSLILVYDLHLGSQNLFEKYFTPVSNGYGNSGTAFSGDARPFSHKSTLQRTGKYWFYCTGSFNFLKIFLANGPILQENDIWNIIIQLTCGLRAIHQANLACRSLDPSKIITDGKRVRFSFLGLTDIVTHDSNQQNPLQLVNHYQQVCYCHSILKKLRKLNLF
jgi:PAB-dependent poly(A)-specific ribonuclease subunit 3